MTRLEQLRLDAQLRPEDLGNLVGVSGMTIRRIEQGKSARVSTLGKLADHFAVRASDLQRDALPAERSAAA